MIARRGLARTSSHGPEMIGAACHDPRYRRPQTPQERQRLINSRFKFNGLAIMAATGARRGVNDTGRAAAAVSGAAVCGRAHGVLWSSDLISTTVAASQSSLP